MPPRRERLIYIDDSGHPQSGRVVYGWVAMEPHQWRDVLGGWLDVRKSPWREFGSPVSEELHTTDYVNGRGRVSARPPERYTDDGVTRWKDLGRDVAVRCLSALASLEGLRVGAVAAVGEPTLLATTRRDLYVRLLTSFEEELAEKDALGMILMDGDGTDPQYRSAHRALTRRDRRVIEDPVLQDSRSSQLIQMADLVAWTANAHVDRHRANTFAHDWYADHLSARDVRREPRIIDLGHS